MAIKSYLLIELNGVEKNGVRQKSFLGVLVFGHPYCSSNNSIEFNVEHESTCSFLCHLGSSIPTFWGHVLTCNCAKKNCFIMFCVKFKIYKKYLRKTAMKISFSFHFFTIPYQRNSMENLYPKKKSYNIFPTRHFCW